MSAVNGTGHLREWAPAISEEADAAFARLIEEKQDIAPGELIEIWNQDNLFQLPGGYADLDLGGRVIHGLLRLKYLYDLLLLALKGPASKVSYDIVEPFVKDSRYRGNPVFGENSLRTRGGFFLDDVRRCVYNRCGFVDKFALPAALKAKYACMVDETVKFSETFGLAYTIGAHLYHKNLLLLAMEPEIVERVSSLLGDNVVLLSAHTFTKKPGAPSTPYHHGTSYQPIENTLTVFVGLTDCKEDNSCLRVIPGSEFFAGRDITEDVYKKIHWGHLATDLSDREREQLILQIAFTLRSVQLNLSKFQAHANFAMLSSRIKFLLQSPQARAAIAGFRGIRMELDPFEAFIFSERNFHCSGPNASNRIRCALALRYAKGDEAIDDRSHLRQFKAYGKSRLQGLDKLVDELVGDKLNAVIQVAGDPEAARRAGNNPIRPEDLMAKMTERLGV